MIASLAACLSLVLATAPLTQGADAQREEVRTTWSDGSPRALHHVLRSDDGTLVKDGESESWHRNGERAAVGAYEHGQRIGKWSLYHATGEKRAIGAYREGRRHGTWKLYHEDGARQSQGKYTHGLRTGNWKFWSVDGKFDEARSGKFEVVRLERPDGAPRASGSVSLGQRAGEWEFTWPDGSLQFVGTYRDGVRDGPWHFFHPDGTYDPKLHSGTWSRGRRLADGVELDVPLELLERFTAAESTTLLDFSAHPPHPDLTPTQVADIEAVLEVVLAAPRDAPDPEHVEAFQRLWTYGHRALPAVANRMRGRDLAQRADLDFVGGACIAMLRELCGGEPDAFDLGPTPDLAANRLAVARWNALIHLAARDPELWDLDVKLARERKTTADSIGALLRAWPFDEGRLPSGLDNPVRATPEAARVYGPRYVDNGREVTTEAVEAALAWLARCQLDDGSWDADGFEDDRERFGVDVFAFHDVGTGSLALLTFFAAGHTSLDGPYRETIVRALTWLCRLQKPDGSIAYHGSDSIYDHALATLVLLEASAFSRSPGVRDAAERGLAFLTRGRNPYGAWRYDVPPQGDNDTSVTAWCLQALRAGDWLGLPIEDEVLHGALAWFEEATDSQNGRTGYDSIGSLSSRLVENNDHPREFEAMTAAALFARSLHGALVPGDAATKNSLELIRQKLPTWDTTGLLNDMYAWYYLSQASHQLGEPFAERWHRALVATALESQRKDGEAAGSWDPRCVWGLVGGRIYATSMMTLSLLAPRRLARLSETGQAR